MSVNAVSDLVGFYLLWHLHGGFDGLRELGMSRASIYRKMATFRKMFGARPNEYTFPGITVDVEAYSGKQRRKTPDTPIVANARLSTGRGSTVSLMRLSPSAQLAELASGVDSFYLSGRSSP